MSTIFHDRTVLKLRSTIYTLTGLYCTCTSERRVDYNRRVVTIRTDGNPITFLEAFPATNALHCYFSPNEISQCRVDESIDHFTVVCL